MFAFKILNPRKFFADCFEILTQRCIRIRACFYVPILVVYYYTSVECTKLVTQEKVYWVIFLSD
jgi:hypothetical protein